ncbi:MAG TPA: acetoacetyl-CoA reductase [Rickettsiales bacterium]|nr:acetoacetyl-CoA reductase [Rickettsiales bacterium]
MTRVALVTGGTTGIGAATCKALKAAGYKVAANYVANEEQARTFGKENDIKVYQWDVTHYDQCAKGIEQIGADFGSPVEILVNNAGITRDNMMHKMTPKDWDSVITTDLSAVFYMSRAVINSMREKQFGRIVNISSVNAQMGQIGQTNYSAAKAGIIGFSKALARETARKGITVNVIAPGYTDTDMVKTVPEDVMKNLIAQIPIGRLAKPEEIAHAILFLVSDQSACITGEVLSVNGGYHME